MATRTSKKQPIYYTYLIGWSHLDIWYYGSKYSQDADPKLFWTKYFTSSEYVATFRNENGEPDVKIVRKQGFTTPEECRWWEHKVLRRFNAAQSPRWLNKSNGDGKFHNTGMTTVVDDSGKRYHVGTDDERIKTGNLKHLNKGMTVVKDKSGRHSRVTIDTLQNHTDELVGIAKGMIPVKDKSGRCFHATVSDTRVLSGELVHVTKGLVQMVMPDGTVKTVPKDDPRRETGEIHGVYKGMTNIIDESGKCIKVSTQDERVISGNFKTPTSGKTTVRDKNGNTLSVDINDTRITNEELSQINAGKKVVRMKDGTYKQVSAGAVVEGCGGTTKGMIRVKKPGHKKSTMMMPSDSRVLSGEYLPTAKRKQRK